MSLHQEKSNETMMPVPDITTVSDSKDKEVVNLEAVTQAARAKLEEDLAKEKTQNEEIAWNKKEQVDHLRKQKEDEDAAEAKKKADKEVVEAKKKADEEARKKVPVQPPVSSVCLPSWGRN